MRILPLLALACSLSAAQPKGLLLGDGKVTEVAGDYILTGGLAAGLDGQIYFTDVPNDRILLRLVDGTIGTWLDDSGGANGVRFYGGLLYACQGTRRQVVSIGADKAVKTLAFQCAGKRFNAPDDLWVDDEGGVYFTDPRGAEPEQVFYIAAGSGEVRSVARDFSPPQRHPRDPQRALPLRRRR
ncbi:MAG: hypothetical protein QM757_35205 [Paludibaculum sp.]